MSLPTTSATLDEWLSTPGPELIETLRPLEGDLLILGAGGKMGPTLARLARRVWDATGNAGRVIAVSRFGDPQVRARLEDAGVETLSVDLLAEGELERLPDCPHVVFMTGFKFGASGTPDYTWAMNCYLPALVARRFAGSRIAAFSSGNVYGPVSIKGLGSRETDELRPVGEYAMTCVGRERMLQYMSRTCGAQVAILRLNYATELRYGVLVDIAQRVRGGRPVELGSAYVNVIWLADANAMALASLAHTASPARIINVAGLELLRVRDVAEQFAARWNVRPVFTGEEQEVALLNDGRDGAARLGIPQVPAAQMIDWTAAWLEAGGETWDKPTHFEATDGRF